MPFYPRTKEGADEPLDPGFQPLNPPEDPDFGPPVVPTTTPPTTPTTPTDWSSILRSIFGNPSGGNVMNPAMLATYLGTVYNHYKDSDRWTSMAEKYADQLDPFGKERPGYQDQLRSLMTDPEGYVKNDPAYASMMRMALNPVQSMMRSKGYGNSGNILTALTQVAGDTTNKYLSDLRKDLGNFSGAQFGPNAAASILSQGMAGSIGSRNQALGDIGALLGNLWRTDGNKKPGGDDPTNIANLIRTTSGLFKPSDLTSLIRYFRNSGGGFDMARMQELGLSPDQIMQIITNGEDTGTPYPEEPPEFPEEDPITYPEIEPPPEFSWDDWNDLIGSDTPPI
jgi:hypothetical protein